MIESYYRDQRKFAVNHSHHLSIHLLIITIILGGGPQSKVIPQQLHDEGAVFVRGVIQSVQFLNGGIEGFLGEVASFLWFLEDFVVTHAEIQANPNRVGWVSFKLASATSIASL